ncbi:replication-associated recombination protein A [Candidatus Kinetoplastidibacterium galati]|uniref:Replication-associated recombination protein A n=1 Tax=Candidatus Kinetoplastidibacterium galati TCC219 TaxID=1208921 RepID=M1M1V8_9PROT|nr:replication-associated recombination protein A [Candidatus Kinetoplastibacterium galatii]AGF49219.1 recombination factor protein RarA [Candidatus Kinetoplastibacterium galatii TCC219]
MDFDTTNLDKQYNSVPLYERLRPRNLDDIIGQSHLVGLNKPLRIAMDSGKLYSMILWGPPGVGKTTIAKLLSHNINYKFLSISAVLSGVKDIRDAIISAKNTQCTGKRTILFIDEIHDFNKSQQDAFLPYVENGLFILIGATTENPSFNINSALLSRLKVYALNQLDQDDLSKLLSKVLLILNKECTESKEVDIDINACALIISMADGDARRLISLVEIIFGLALSSNIDVITVPWLKINFSKDCRMFDKCGGLFYDQISALHKSIRGSDPDAALYWLASLLSSGTDPIYISRRLMRIATEDIGLADPRAIDLSVNCAMVYQSLGSPEGELALANAVVYMSCAAKSNSVYNAFNSACKYVNTDSSRSVPTHLRNSSKEFMKKIGLYRDYKYVHEFPNAYVPSEQYFPDGIKEQFYFPTSYGLEQKIKQKMSLLKGLDIEEDSNKSC